MSEQNDIDAIAKILLACGDRTTEERLTLLQLAWLCVAFNARSEGLPVPGGFPAEQARQIEELEKMIRFVRSDRPDLEMERLCQEEDWDGLRKHLARRLSEGAKGIT